MNHLQAIKSYLASGLSPVPIKIKDKYPSMLREWRGYMKRTPTEQEVNLWSVYRNSNEYGCGIVCGQVSGGFPSGIGGLEVIDFDNHLGNVEEVFNEYTSIPDVQQIISENQIVIETTPSGGYHLFYRCSVIEGNQKLAKQQEKAVIETRGEGGLIVTAPTKGYEVVSGDLCNIPVITPEERDVLFGFARSYNTELAPETGDDAHTPRTDNPCPGTDTPRPGDYYNENCAGEIPALLSESGWTHISGKHWRRPGKKTGVSATFSYIAPGILYVFTSNGHPFDENRAYKPFSVYTLLKHDGDFSSAAREIVARFPDDLGKPPRGAGSPPAGGSRSNEAGGQSPPIPPPVQEYFNIKNPVIIHDEVIDFYYITDKGSIKISWANMRRFLTRHGFFRYKTGFKYSFVRVIHNIADFVTLEDIQNYILNFLLNSDLEEAHDKLWDTDKLNDKKLQLLQECEPKFIRDPEDSSYVFFKNTAVHVTKFGKETIPYSDLPGFVWKQQIITRDYNDLKEEVFDYCDFAEFCKRISNNTPDRVQALLGGMGYLMHTFKDPAFPPVINFTDESNDDSPAGGSGKGILFQAVARIRNVVFVDGKNFDPKHPFALQRISEDTDIVFFQDMDKRFDFEAFFSMVTDGMVVRKLYQGEKFIGYKETPKIGLNANYQIKGDSDSYERRLFDVEIHKYFNLRERTIITEYGHRFFEDGWDHSEWNKFDNFMMYCIQFYLRNGLQKPDYVFVAENKLKANTSPEFVSWAKNIIPNKRYEKSVIYEMYRHESGDDTTKQRYFTRYLKTYAKYKGWEIADRVGNGGREIEFLSKDDPQPEASDGSLPF